jgi:hypothetical protein
MQNGGRNGVIMVSDISRLRLIDHEFEASQPRGATVLFTFLIFFERTPKKL